MRNEACVSTIQQQAGRAGCKRSRRLRCNLFKRQNQLRVYHLLLVSLLCTLNGSTMRFFVSGLAVPLRRRRSTLQWNTRVQWKQRGLLPSSSFPRRSSLSCGMTPGTTAPTSTLSEDVSTIQNCCDRLFDLQLPEGRCVGIQLPEIKDDDPDSLTPQAISDQLDQHWLYKVLHAEEIAYGVEQPACQASRESFFIGRLAMRQALGLHYVSTTDPILKDAHGRPAVPAGFLGSISHKRRTAVALVAVHEQEQQADTGMGDGSRPRLGIGVDIEQTVTSSRNSIARKVLTVRERETLGRIEGLTIDEEVLLRFSIKESLYKAMHPLICQYVGFQEAEVEPAADGSVVVALNLNSRAHLQFRTVTAHWRRLADLDLFLTSASVTLKEMYS